MYFFKISLLADLTSSLFFIVAANSTNAQTVLEKHQWNYDTVPYGSEATINVRSSSH